MVAATDRAWVVKAGVADRDVVRLTVGDSAHVSVDAYPDRVIRATITEIAQGPDPMTGTYEVELALEPTDRHLLSGFSADLTIFPSVMQLNHLVPMDALIEADGARAIVFAVDTDLRAREHTVIVGDMVGARVAVSALPRDTITVIVNGAAYVDDGDMVSIPSTRRNQSMQ
jgi:multidrug efflux pump subunit AcrA (membrane-fusion protein)